MFSGIFYLCKSITKQNIVKNGLERYQYVYNVHQSRSLLRLEDDVEGVDDARDDPEEAEEDVDQEGAAAAVHEGDCEGWKEEGRYQS